MDRLLSEQELRTIGLCIIAQARDGYVTGEGVTQVQYDTAKAQLAKTDKWWIENIENHMSGCKYAGSGLCVTTNCSRDIFTPSCSWWQDLKEELLNGLPQIT